MITATDARQLTISRTLTFTIFLPIQITLSQVTRVKNIFAENRRLKEQLTQLNTQIAFLQEKAEENKRLKDMIEFKEHATYELIPAHTIAREPVQQFRSLVIDVGNDKNLEKFMPIVNNYGVVGKIIAVLPRVSLIQLLKDPSNRTSVITSRSRQVGILETETGNSFFIRYRSYADVNPGDTVVTSGLGGVYPKGLYVGVIEEIEKENNTLFKRTTVKPMVNFEQLEEVFVLRVSPQWRSHVEVLDSLGYIK